MDMKSWSKSVKGDFFIGIFLVLVLCLVGYSVDKIRGLTIFGGVSFLVILVYVNDKHRKDVEVMAKIIGAMTENIRRPAMVQLAVKDVFLDNETLVFKLRDTYGTFLGAEFSVKLYRDYIAFCKDFYWLTLYREGTHAHAAAKKLEASVRDTVSCNKNPKDLFIAVDGCLRLGVPVEAKVSYYEIDRFEIYPLELTFHFSPLDQGERIDPIQFVYQDPRWGHWNSELGTNL